MNKEVKSWTLLAWIVILHFFDSTPRAYAGGSRSLGRSCFRWSLGVELFTVVPAARLTFCTAPVSGVSIEFDAGTALAAHELSAGVNIAAIDAEIGWLYVGARAGIGVHVVGAAYFAVGSVGLRTGNLYVEAGPLAVWEFDTQDFSVVERSVAGLASIGWRL